MVTVGLDQRVLVCDSGLDADWHCFLACIATQADDSQELHMPSSRASVMPAQGLGAVLQGRTISQVKEATS